MSDCHENTAVIQSALTSLTTVVKTIYQKIVSSCNQDKISFFVGTKLTKRTNALFTKLIGHWLVSDALVEFFVYTLKGFEFLLDTISNDCKPSSGAVEESKEPNREEKQSALRGSDLEELFMKAAVQNVSDVSSMIDTTSALNSDEKSSSDEAFNAPLMELAKTKFVL